MLKDKLIERLKTFQDVLMERVSIEKEVKELPKSIIAQEEVLLRARKSYSDRSQRLADIQARVLHMKAELAEVIDHKDRSEQQMDNISSPREFEALNKEITEAGLKEDQLRKDLRKEEENLKEAENEVKASQSLIASQESEINEKKTKILNEEASMLGRITELKKIEEELTNDLDPEIVFKFERIIKSKQGIGVVPVKGVVCSGCSIVLPAQFVNSVRQSNTVVFCPYCSRVLSYEEGDLDHDDMIVDIESGSLADLDDFGDDEEADYDGEDDIEDDAEKGGLVDSDN